MEKKIYVKPVLAIERFMANEYIANCFTYRANLVCDYGQYHKEHSRNGQDTGPNVQPYSHPYCWEGGNGNHHGAACAESTVTVTVRNDEITLVGTEGADKTMVNLQSVNIPGVDSVSEVGQNFSNCNWVSTYAGLTYKHIGSGTVTYFSRQANAS